jgi:nucleotide-binding universal stress UspA family protein
MDRFKNILLPLDVTGEGFHKGEALPRRIKTAIAEACWLAKQSGGQLTVMTVVEATDSPDVREAALDLLKTFVVPELDGVEAAIVVEVGEPWHTIIRYVMKRDIDLVIVASQRSSMFERTIIGSTAIRLLRKCPCPVWVAARQRNPGAWVVLSAVGSSRLRPAIMDLSAEMVAARGGEWHVLHCVEYPDEGGMRLQHRPQDEIDAYRKGVREETWDDLKKLTAERAGKAGVTPQVWMAEGRPSERIELAIREQDAHLVVMSTLGRAGLPGAIIGNTAERVFKQVECSVLAIKPEGFESPVKP